MDGNGLEKIEDASLAYAILDRVEATNIKIGLGSILVAGSYAALPQSSSAPFSGLLLLLGGKFKRHHELRGTI